jgi:hypothetical protein
MGSGREVGKENVRKFSEYWQKLLDNDEYLPLKPDGTVWVEKVVGGAKIGKSALRQNPQVKEIYINAVAITLEANREKVELALGASSGEAAAEIKKSSIEALNSTGEKREEVKLLKQRISELEQQVAVLTAASLRAGERAKRTEEVERENLQLRALVEKYEFQTEHAINPGPY